MAKIKPVTMESETFKQIKEDMTTTLNRLLRRMQSFHADEASLTLKISIELSEEDTGDGTGIVPVFKHTVASAVQVKDKKQGEMGGDYTLEEDGSGGYNLKPIIDQTSMLEEAE